MSNRCAILEGYILITSKRRRVEVYIKSIVDVDKINKAKNEIVNAIKHYLTIRPIGQLKETKFRHTKLIKCRMSLEDLNKLESLEVKVNGFTDSLLTHELGILVAEFIESI